MKRILVVADDPVVLSAGHEARQVAASLTARGVDVLFLVLATGAPFPDQPFPELFREKVIPWPRRFCTTAWRSVNDEVRRFQPDEIQVWGRYGEIVASVLSRMTKRPVWHVLESVASHRMRGTARRLVTARPGQGGTLVRHESLQHRIREIGLVGDRSTGVLPWFRYSLDDPDELRSTVRKRLGIPRDCWLAGTAARFTTRSRMKDFMWAADLLGCSRDDVYWMGIGDGPQAWRLRRYATQLETGDRLRLLGNRDDALELVAALDVYVQTSDWYDDYRGLRAAMSFGVPAIGARRTIHDRLIEDRRTGYLVERGARNEIARCVNRLVNERQILATMSHATKLAAQRLLVSTDEACEAVTCEMRGFPRSSRPSRR